jgi:hypothetical protein
VVAVIGFVLVIGDSLFVPDESISEHMGFYLGPVNDVIGGRAMLVETWSQYGNGVMYALVPWFSIAPIGFGTFAILTTTATTLQYLIVYAILRLTVRSQVVAIATVALATAVILFAQLGDYANYPSIGVLRFGPPYVVLLLGILAARSARRRKALVVAAALVVAISVPWSAETGATTVAVAGAMLAADALARPGSGRRRLRRLALALAGLACVCVAAFTAFCVATRLAAGAWPDWNPYIGFLRLYTTGGFGTLPVPEWSPGLVVGAIYAASAVMVAALVLLRPDVVRDRPEAPLACAGLVALGVVSYTYFLGRSHPNNVMHVCLPAFALVALWFDGRGVAILAGRDRGRRWAAALLTAFAIVGVVDSFPSIRAKWPRTVFAAALPLGGAGATQQSLSLRVQDLWSNPPVDPLAPASEAFVRRFGAGRPLVVVMRPSLFAETLLHLRRTDAMPIASPSQDSLSPESLPRVQRAAAELDPGARLFVLTDVANNVVLDDLTELQLAELELLDERFERRLVARDPATGLTAFELASRG